MLVTSHAERAPVFERVKRAAVMLLTPFLVAGVFAVAGYVAELLSISKLAGMLAVGYLVTVFVVWDFLIDFLDVVPPKEFREAENVD
jgi:hypothetical protein